MTTVFEMFKSIGSLPMSISNLDLGSLTQTITVREYIVNYEGSIPRTIAERFSRSVSVKDFGAQVDGVTDDTDAIQNALDCGADYVLFPAGTYRISSTINITQSCTLEALGKAIIKPVDGLTTNMALVTIQTGDLTIEGFSFEGNVSGGTASNRAIDVDQGSYKNITITDCMFTGFSNYGINAFESGSLDNFRIRGCNFKDFDSGDFGCIQLTEPSITGLLVENCRFDAITGTAIGVRDNGVGGILKGITIRSCNINHSSYGIVAIGVEVWNATDVSITNCIFKNSSNAIVPTGSMGVVISGNTFFNHTVRTIDVDTAGFVSITNNVFEDFENGVYIDRAVDVYLISNNVFRNGIYPISITRTFEKYSRVVISGNAINNSLGPDIGDVENFVFESNIMHFNETSVFNIQDTCNNGIISNNQFTITVSPGNLSLGIIRFRMTNALIESNQIICTAVGQSGMAGIINIGGASDRVVIRKNTIRNFSRGVLITDSTPGDVTNSIVSQNQYYNCAVPHVLVDGVQNGFNPCFIATFNGPIPQNSFSQFLAFSTIVMNRRFGALVNDMPAIPEAGLYHITLYINWQARVIGARFYYMRSNGSNIINGSGAGTTLWNAGSTYQNATYSGYFNAGDVITFVFYHNTSSPLNANIRFGIFKLV